MGIHLSRSGRSGARVVRWHVSYVGVRVVEDDRQLAADGAAEPVVIVAAEEIVGVVLGEIERLKPPPQHQTGLSVHGGQPTMACARVR